MSAGQDGATADKTARYAAGVGRDAPVTGADAATAAQYRAAGWWGDRSYADHLQDHAHHRGDRLAFVEGDDRLTWRAYDERSDQLAAVLAEMGFGPGDRVAVLLPDGPAVHVAYMAVEKAGLVVVGIGPRAGTREIEHLLTASGAAALLSPARHRGHDLGDLVAALGRRGLPLRQHVALDDNGLPAGRSLPAPVDARPTLAGRDLGPDQLFLLNSTSGTTGLPKCVMHTQNRWVYFHQLAVAAGQLTPDDVFMSVIPAPFGFGLWTAHVTPLLLGAPTVVMQRFTAADAIRLVERERVTVLAAVSTQFIMMLDEPALGHHDLGSLRVLFTGGEAVPYERAAAFEERTGACVLQFYGSNETGALSRTSVHDSREDRLRTAGRVIDEMAVRLFAEDGTDVTAVGGPGQPACRGPATCLGYDGDPVANAQLHTAGGWMLTGDIAVLDDRGYLRVVGRKSDFVIRGGKNISAAAVEAEVLSHPDVGMAAAVAMPSEVFGERVCVYVVTRGATALTLDDLTAHLAARGVSKEWWPEHLVLVEDLPRSSGGKVAKGELRADARHRAAGGRQGSP